ncbi:MAG: ABC transporter permease [Alloprevotella sp.]
MVLRFLLQKEFKQMMRNTFLPKVFVVLPFVMLLIMPRVATQEVKNLKIGIVDSDHSAASTRLVHKLSASDYFTLRALPSTYAGGLKNMAGGDIDLLVEIEPDFERRLVREGVAHVMISANATDGQKAGLGTSYLSQTVADFSTEICSEMGLANRRVSVAQFDVKPRYLYNETLDYKAYMIPGLMSMLMVLVVGFLPALNIVGEKEKGTIEQINVTPVGRFELIFSKLIPYWCVGLFILAYSMLLSRWMYGLVPVGSVAEIFLFATIFVLVVSCLGLIVSNFSDTTQQAALVMFFFLIIFILLSGLLTPVASMPEWARAITCVNPFRYFIEAMRALYLKGSSIADLSTQLLALIAYAVVVWSVAIVSYRKKS